eukprot:CAMPEP_0198419706 /NCGR_PEP_ID=MMETSP1452-20131203/396_1 /TAXON_ID=1181717 /ORGANISM="Synchroma pusillum, Strain CCMP3072" /LENGTH=226 /DNA_ID=CAMNT_0044139843 /DNA_START=113 /DNA_END=793 /DNA_ORIENTATION=-
MDGATLHYFRIRGKGEPIRLALEDQGVAYTNDIIPFEDWGATKARGVEAGNLPFGQVPWLSHDGLELVQMNAILRYVARRLDLYGDGSPVDAAKVDMYLDGIEDWRVNYLRLIYRDQLSDTAKTGFAEAVAAPLGTRGGGQLAQFEAILRANGGDFLLGARITVADYSLLALIDDQLRVLPEMLAASPLLSAWNERMRARPNLARYMALDAEAAPWRAVVNGNSLG